MPVVLSTSKCLLGVAALALTLASGHASAGTPDRAATALWGPSSMVWLTNGPSQAVKAEPDLKPAAAPRLGVMGEALSGPGSMMQGKCLKGKKGDKAVAVKAMREAHAQTMTVNAPLHKQMMTLQGEAKALWTAPHFDRDAWLAKRAEVRALQGQMGQNHDAAMATAGTQMTVEQRAQMQCWFKKHHAWFHDKMQAQHRGAGKKYHHGHGMQHKAHAAKAVPDKAEDLPAATQARTAEPPKAEEKPADTNK